MKKTKMSQFIDRLISENQSMSTKELQDFLSRNHKINLNGNALRQRKSRLGIRQQPSEKVETYREQRQVQKQKLDLRKEADAIIAENEILRKERDAVLQMEKNYKPHVFTYQESTLDNEAVAFAIASDWHLEEIVNPAKVNGLNKYNLHIAQERASQFFQNVVKLVKKEQNATKIDTLVLALLGDFISSNIHEELLENCELRPIEAIIFAENILAGGINYLLDNTDLKLVIPCSVGNHSRIGKRIHISTEQGNSLESFMYHHLANNFKGNNRVTFLISEGYLQYVEVYGFTVCFSHGHAVRYAGGIGGLSIPLNKAIAQWQKLRTVDLYCMGHWHSFLDNGNAIVNGSLIGYNAFAVFIKANFERPKQSFFLVDKKRKCKTVTTPILFDV